VVLHQDRAVIEQCHDIANEWLADMGLRLKPSKTQIVHTLQHENDTAGFTFLGFHIRHYRVGKTHTSKSGGPGRPTTLLGFTTIIKPSPEALKRHSKHLKDIIRTARAWSQDALIQRLNPIIRGWTGYYASQASTHAFATMSHQVYQKLWSWARHRHRDQSSSTIYATYWPIRRGRRVFATPQGHTLYRHTDRKIERHIKVAGTRSPYDGDWVYWASRQSKHPDTPPHIAALLRKQRGRCAWCGLYFRAEDLSELDHIRPKRRSGAHEWHNWQLIHRHCHDSKTARDGISPKESTDDNSQTIEEPDEAKVSRPVLKQRRGK
jgi:RNA-directed DNA polymerase